MNSLSEVIQKIRKEKNMSVVQLSEKIDMTQSGLSKALKKSDLKYSSLLKIAEVLDVSLSYIIIETEKDNNYEIADGKFEVNEDEVKYERLTSAGKKLLEENEALKNTISDKEKLIEFYEKELKKSKKEK